VQIRFVRVGCTLHWIDPASYVGSNRPALSAIYRKSVCWPLAGLVSMVTKYCTTGGPGAGRVGVVVVSGLVLVACYVWCLVSPLISIWKTGCVQEDH